MAFDVKNFPRQISTETSFRNGNITQLRAILVARRELHPWVMFANGPPWIDSRRMFQRLDEVRFDGVLHEHGRSPSAPIDERRPLRVYQRSNDQQYSKAFPSGLLYHDQGREWPISEAALAICMEQKSLRAQGAGLPLQTDLSSSRQEGSVVHCHADAHGAKKSDGHRSAVRCLDGYGYHGEQQIIGSRNRCISPAKCRLISSIGTTCALSRRQQHRRIPNTGP